MQTDMVFLVQQQRRQEMMQEAEQARLLKAVSRTPERVAETAFQHLTWWFGRALLSWGCALQPVGRTTRALEKGCSVCLP